MSADPSSSPALRASDADRDRVIELLAPPSPTAGSTRSSSTSGWTRRWAPAPSTRWPRSPPI
jgi:hypothetical protein